MEQNNDNEILNSEKSIREAIPADFRLFLQDVLIQRCSKNTSYSLRAFAFSLGVSSSSLSSMLNGKRPITNKMRTRLCLVLNLSPDIIEYFNNNDDSAKSKSDRKITDELNRNYQQLALDSFSLISDWYHYAILQLMRTEGFNWKAQWISKRLGISVSTVNIAIDRLKRIEILSQDEKGTWIDTSEGNTNDIRPEFSSAAQRKLQKTVLQKSIDNIDIIDINLRDNTCITFAMDPADIEFAKKEIKKFRRELSQKLEKKKKLTTVYHLSVSLSPVTVKEQGVKK